MRIVVDGEQIDSNLIESINIPDPIIPDPSSNVPALSGQLQIVFKQDPANPNNSFSIKQGQSVFVSYEKSMLVGGEELADLNDNPLNNFTQVVANSSDEFNDLAAPTLDTTNGGPQLENDGQTFTLTFNEPLDSFNLDTTQLANNFKLFVDGNDFNAVFDDAATQLSIDGTSLTLKLENDRKIEASQQVLIAYSPDLDSINQSTVDGAQGSDTLSGSSGSLWLSITKT